MELVLQSIHEIHEEIDIEPNRAENIVAKPQYTNAFKWLYLAWTLSFIPVGIVIIIFEDKQCPSEHLPWVLIIAEFILFCISLIVELKYKRLISKIIKPCDVLICIWGIVGIIAYALDGYSKMDGSCVVFLWHAILVYDIVSIVSIVNVVFIVYACRT